MKNIKKSTFQKIAFLLLVLMLNLQQCLCFVSKKTSQESNSINKNNSKKPDTEPTIIFGEPIEEIISKLVILNYSDKTKEDVLKAGFDEFFKLVVNHDIESQIKYLSSFHNQILKSLVKINGKLGVHLALQVLRTWVILFEKSHSASDSQEEFSTTENIYKFFIDYSGENVNLLLKPDVENLVQYLKGLASCTAQNLDKLKSEDLEIFSIKDVARILLNIAETIIAKIEWKENQADGVFSDTFELFSIVKNYASNGLIEWDYELTSLYFSIYSRFKIFLSSSKLPESYFENWLIQLESGELNFAQEILDPTKKLLIYWLKKFQNKSITKNAKTLFRKNV